MASIRITAAVLDTRRLTMHAEDGSTITLLQGDPRLAAVLPKLNEDLTNQGWHDLDLPAQDSAMAIYAEYEKMNPLVRFFRIQRDALNELLEQLERTPTTQMGEIISQIMGKAVDTQSVLFTANEQNVAQPRNLTDAAGTAPKQHTETIVAVVEDTVVPNVEMMENQIRHSVATGRTKAVENFLRRAGSVTAQRKFSAESLLAFVEKGDLPICEDGSILVYKSLNTKKEPTNGLVSEKVFVDLHTGRVEQWVGAKVMISENKLDWDSMRECSHGLHIARRQYVRTFNGNVCVLAILAPEDVGVLPREDANKCRTLGYHIIHQLTSEQFEKVKNNESWVITDEDERLLAELLAGNYTAVTHTVTINGDLGTDVVYSACETVDPKPVVEVTEAVQPLAETVREKKVVAAPVDPSQVKTIGQQIKELFEKYKQNRDTTVLEQLKELKKKAKKSWEALGISDPSQLPEPAVNTPKGGIAKGEFAELLRGKLTKSKAARLLELKKKSKKSWTTLGISAADVAKIESML